MADKEKVPALIMIETLLNDADGAPALDSARRACATGSVIGLARSNPQILPHDKIGAYCNAANQKAHELNIKNVTDSTFATIALYGPNTVRPTTVEERLTLNEETRKLISKAAKDGIYRSDGSDTFKTPADDVLPLPTSIAAMAGYDDAIMSPDLKTPTGFENLPLKNLGELLQECYTLEIKNTQSCYYAGNELGLRDKPAIMASR